VVYSRFATYLLVIALTCAPASTALAHPGHDHKVMGVIVAIDDRHITVKTTDGKELTVEVTPTTKFVRAKKAGAFADLKTSMRIVANVGDGAEPLKAKAIEYATPATKSSR
jgi:hypothetical protein